MSKILIEAGEKWIVNPKIILDLGARDCIEAIQFSNKYPDAKIYSFECNPESIPVCKANIQTRSSITLVPKACREYTGKTIFFPVSTNPPRGYSPNIGASSIFKASGHMMTEPIYQTVTEVECIRIDDWAKENNITKIDVVWMDLQGAELLALQGFGNLINTVSVIHTEVTYRELYSGQDLYTELHAFLERNGFVQTYHGKAITVPDWFGEAVYVKKELTSK